MFKVGDKVRCVNAVDALFIQEGNIYTVARVTTLHLCPMIRLIEDRKDFYFAGSRFEPLNPTHSNWE
jgi:hypothetical protein